MKKQHSARPMVGIIMGSDSDWPTMKSAAEACAEFGVPHEVQVISAHRTPRDLERYASAAQQRGLRVIIAGAGGAAHLPGVTAAYTTLPVIGVPMESKALKGLDSLLSIVQMPAGVPVATVDRKSTRLNSSHLGISYAVFCLKKKTQRLKQPGVCSVLANTGYTRTPAQTH